VRHAEQRRGLRAVVFLDTVGSTQIAAALGDERWQTLLRRELQILRKLLKERGGQEVDVAGDGLFALFREPAPAVRFAASAAEDVRELGLEVRAGLHFGEVEFADSRPAGIVVHTGARTMTFADAGEVIVTQGVRDLLTGGHLRFTDHGTHELKGIPGTWPLFRLTEVDDEPVRPPLGEEEAGARREKASQSVPLVKRRSFLVGAGAAAVVAAAGAYVLPRSDYPRAKPPRALGSQRLFKYDPAQDELTMLPTILQGAGSAPCIAVGEGAVWTGDFYLHHVDPTNGSAREPINLGRANADFVLAIAIGFDDVWVVTGSGLNRIDPGDDEELGFVRLLQGGFEAAVVTGFGSVWVANVGGSLARIEPTKQLPLIAEIPIDGVPSGVVVTGDKVWLSDEFGTLIPVDPARNRALRPVTIGGSPKALAATMDRLWAVDPIQQNVQVVDIETRSPVTSIPLGGKPVDVAAGLGAIWVADLEGRLVKVDEAQLSVVDRQPVDGPVAAIAIDEDAGLVWMRTTHA
jgi:class 3 adenylate cyclase/streptogramin lyase